MWNGIGWYGFIGVITTSTTDISLAARLLGNFAFATQIMIPLVTRIWMCSPICVITVMR